MLTLHSLSYLLLLLKWKAPFHFKVLVAIYLKMFCQVVQPHNFQLENISECSRTLKKSWIFFITDYSQYKVLNLSQISSKVTCSCPVMDWPYCKFQPLHMLLCLQNHSTVDKSGEDPGFIKAILSNLSSVWVEDLKTNPTLSNTSKACYIL